MSVTVEVRLAPNTDLRPTPGSGRWATVAPGLWLRAPSDLTVEVADVGNQAQQDLIYSFMDLCLTPEDKVAIAPLAADNLLAAAKAVLDKSLEGLKLTRPPRWQPVARVAPQLAGPGAMVGNGGRHRRAHNLTWNEALADFLARAAEKPDSLDDTIARALAVSARDLPVASEARLAVDVDHAAGWIRVRFSSPDPGYALPGAGAFQKRGSGHLFAAEPAARLASLRAAQAGAYADWLASAVLRLWPGAGIVPEVDVTLGPATLRRGQTASGPAPPPDRQD